MIDRDTINRIMDATNIVEVVSDFMTLRRAGTNFKGLCPFHNEKTPSFMVSPAKGIYHCFGCGKGGTAVGFIMDHEQMTYPEALHWLADKYHIRIEEREPTDEEKQQQSKRESMFIVNERAAQYFQDTLRNNPDGKAFGMAYFRGRGFRDDIIEKFRLGYARSERGTFARQLLGEGYKEEYLLAAGLCGKREDGSLYDRFAGRVIFPWIGLSGKVVAFGGRLLDSRTKGVNQKYINSPESDIYHKDHELYGIYQAKRAIVKEDCVYMVEGYTDVISMHQCGIENVVANSGTALSYHQVHTLHRFTQNIVLLYDGDEAGIHAALRGADMLLGEGMNVKVLLLPDGNDPDSFARNRTAEEFKAYIETNKTDFIQFKTQLLMKGAGKDPMKRAGLIKNIVQSIAVIPDAIVRSVYVQECSRSMNVDEKVVLREIGNIRINLRNERLKKEKTTATGSEPPTPRTESDGTEEDETVLTEEQAADGSLNQAKAESHILLNTPMAQKEYNLIQAVVQYGHRMLSEDSSTDEQIPTVIEYIHDVLAVDKLEMSIPFFNFMLNDAYEHRNDRDFECPRYFLNHPDTEIGRAAIKFITEPHQLSRMYQKKDGNEQSKQADRLYDSVPRMVQEFRLAYVQQTIKNIRSQMTAAGNSQSEEMMILMKQLVNLQAIERILAKEVGDRVVL